MHINYYDYNINMQNIGYAPRPILETQSNSSNMQSLQQHNKGICYKPVTLSMDVNKTMKTEIETSSFQSETKTFQGFF